MSPRPILKPSASCVTAAARGVHFPPSPRLTRTFSALPSCDYDRSPIVVCPNTCALPERGGRTYTDDEPAPCSPTRRSRSSRERLDSGEVHPRALAPASAAPVSPACPSYPSLPPLVPDFSSESDESDGFMSPPPESQPQPVGVYSASTSTIDLLPSALAFLPHAPKHAVEHTEPQPIPARPSRPRRVRRESPQARPMRRSSMYGEEEEDGEYDDDNETVVSYSPSQRRAVPRRKKSNRSSEALCSSMSSFSISPTEDCLGGF
ncbi:hypothetical protein GGG16DRAFT_64585 [Schizophyllum commune]|nr:hypothetical protein K525DRAFT_212351 [Schizophyllum commune Loenen D]